MRPGISSMEELFPPRKPSYKALPREVTDGDRKFMHDELDKLGRFTALRRILSPEPPVEEPIIISVEDAVLGQAYMEAPCKQSWLSRALLLSPSRIADIAKKTAGQRTNPLWCIVRKHRITASNFGAVLGSIGRNRYPTSLMKRLLSAYNLEAVKSVAWGINHESVALRGYQPGDGLIENTGIWMHECGVLGASPDGLVKAALTMPVMFQSPAARHFLPDIIEAKCPYAASTVGIQAADDTVKGFCLGSYVRVLTMALSAAEKARRYRIRRDQDPLRCAAYLAKESEKYKKDVQNGKRVLAKNMTKRQHRAAKKKWRNEKKDLRQRQKLVAACSSWTTPPNSAEGQVGHENNASSRQKERAIRKRNREKLRCYSENEELKTKADIAERKADMYRERWERSRQAKKVETPHTKQRNF